MSEIRVFVHDALSAGKTRVEIGNVLLEAGWRQDEVNKALAEFAEVDFVVPVPRKRPHLFARDAFQHLVEFLTLYISAIGAGTLLFQFINLLLPDPLRREEWYRSEIYSTLRSAAAAVIIAFPIFLWMARLLRQEYQRDTERRSSPIRKWLTYMNMFVATAMVICYLIALVYQFLGGEFSLSFVLKVVIVIGIAGAVFEFYMPGLRQDERQSADGLRTSA